MTKCLHFIGFDLIKDPQRAMNAVLVFGKPDFLHRTYDVRSLADIAPGDKVVFAQYEDRTPCPHAHDDSNQPDDPAAKERN